MDSAALSAQWQQAKTAFKTTQGQRLEADADVRTAAAQLQQASRPPLASDVARLRADTEQNIRMGQAKLAGARQRQDSLYQRYVEMKNGARAEDIAQAQTQVEQAETNLTQLARDRDRQRALYTDYAVARADVERAETNYLVGKQTLDNARSRLRQLQAGNRAEQIAQAQADYLASREDSASGGSGAARGEALRAGANAVAAILAPPGGCGGGETGAGNRPSAPATWRSGASPKRGQR